MHGEFSPLFMLKLMAKDARLSRAMLPPVTTENGKSMLDAAISTLELAESAGLGEEDFSAVLKIVRQRWSMA
jgi:3-hydroxyisobutyrate dehydrogenase-like beta-hydroxyacid dehydrogenase